MHWANDYVGIPFAWNGYARDGCGCWGLCVLVEREIFGRDLPRHDDFNRQVSAGNELDPTLWETGTKLAKIPVEDAGEGDLLHMWGVYRNRKIPLHVGVMTGPMAVLHIEEGTGAIVDDLTKPRSAWRPIQAYQFV